MAKDALADAKRGNTFRYPRLAASSPAFYTGNAAFNDTVATLERAISHARRILTARQLLPVPEFARATFPVATPVWKSAGRMSAVVGVRLKPKTYKRVTGLLNQLAECYSVARHGDAPSVERVTKRILDIFGAVDADPNAGRGVRRPVQFDAFGRAYARGRRKEASARVWLIASKTAGNPSVTMRDGAEFYDPAVTDAYAAADGGVPVTTVLVNNLPLAEYFANPADRERVLRPLKLTAMLGAFNVFAIARGGGTTGQSGAIAHGLAQALAAHVPESDLILRRALLLRRDPRVVERKKAGRAKARKKYAWVKR